MHLKKQTNNNNTVLKESPEFSTTFSPTGQGVGDSFNRHHFKVMGSMTPPLTPQTQEKEPTYRTFMPPQHSDTPSLKRH